MIIKLLEKYISFEERNRRHFKTLLDRVVNLDEAIKILTENGDFIGNQLIEKMKKDPNFEKLQSGKDVQKEIETIQEGFELNDKRIEQYQSELELIKNDHKDQGSKAKLQKGK